jgi:hypothetical protein
LGLLLAALLEKLGLLALHAIDQSVVAARLDDLVELGAVVRHEADALDVDVVDHPVLAPPEEPVVDGHLCAVLGDDLGAHDGEVAIRALAVVDDLLAPVQLDLRDVGALEEVTEEPDELTALRRGQRLPVAAEGPARDLAEVEDLVGDLADRAAPLGGLAVALECGALEGGDDAVDGALELLLGRGGPAALGR